MTFLRLYMKIIRFFLIALFLFIPCLGQANKNDSATALPPPMKQKEKTHLIDTAETKDTAQAKQAHVSDTVGAADTMASDTIGKKKDEGLVDTVFYGTEGGYIDYDVERKTMRLIHQASVSYQKRQAFRGHHYLSY